MRRNTTHTSPLPSAATLMEVEVLTCIKQSWTVAYNYHAIMETYNYVNNCQTLLRQGRPPTEFTSTVCVQPELRLFHTLIVIVCSHSSRLRFRLVERRRIFCSSYTRTHTGFAGTFWCLPGGLRGFRVVPRSRVSRPRKI